MKDKVKRVIELVDNIEENVEICCGSSMEPDMVELWCFELKEILKELYGQGRKQ